MGQTKNRTKFLAGALLLLVTAVFGLWIYGIAPPPPVFKLGPPESGRILPVEWSWWRLTADRLHGRQYVMLTFDDGPADSATNSRILEVLAQHKALAAFFLVCRNAQTPQQIADLKAMAAQGHVIANHSFHHLVLPNLDTETRRTEIAQCRDHLRAVSGKPVHWFRPPFGRLNPDVEAQLVKEGQQLVLWSANSGDTWLNEDDSILKLTINRVKDGTILLLHSSPQVAGLLDSILTELEARGFKFVVPLEEGLGRGGS